MKHVASDVVCSVCMCVPSIMNCWGCESCPKYRICSHCLILVNQLHGKIFFFLTAPLWLFSHDFGTEKREEAKKMALMLKELLKEGIELKNALMARMVSFLCFEISTSSCTFFDVERCRSAVHCSTEYVFRFVFALLVFYFLNLSISSAYLC